MSDEQAFEGWMKIITHTGIFYGSGEADPQDRDLARGLLEQAGLT